MSTYSYSIVFKTYMWFNIYSVFFTNILIYKLDNKVYRLAMEKRDSMYINMKHLTDCHWGNCVQSYDWIWHLKTLIFNAVNIVDKSEFII